MRSKKGDNRTRLIQAAVKMTYRHGFANTSLRRRGQGSQSTLGQRVLLLQRPRPRSARRSSSIVCRSICRDAAPGMKPLPQKNGCAPSWTMYWRTETCLPRVAAPWGPSAPSCTSCRRTAHSPRRRRRCSRSTWSGSETQFRSLKKGKEARPLAVHLLSALQGVAVLAHCLGDPSLVETEIERLKQWIQGL